MPNTLTDVIVSLDQTGGSYHTASRSDGELVQAVSEPETQAVETTRSSRGFETIVIKRPPEDASIFGGDDDGFHFVSVETADDFTLPSDFAETDAPPFGTGLGKFVFEGNDEPLWSANEPQTDTFAYDLG